MSKPSAVPARSACHRMSHLTSPEAEARSLAVSLCVARLGPVLVTAMVTRSGYRPQRNGEARLADACSPEPQEAQKPGRGRTRGRCRRSPGQGQTVGQLRCIGAVRHMVAVLGPGHLRLVRACLSDTAREEAIPSRRGPAGEPGRNAGRTMQESPPSYAMPLCAGTEWADEGRCDPH